MAAELVIAPKPKKTALSHSADLPRSRYSDPTDVSRQLGRSAQLPVGESSDDLYATYSAGHIRVGLIGASVS